MECTLESGQVGWWDSDYCSRAFKEIAEDWFVELHGTARKLMDNSKTTAIGWWPETSLEDGIASVYENFRRNQE